LPFSRSAPRGTVAFRRECSCMAAARAGGRNLQPAGPVGAEVWFLLPSGPGLCGPDRRTGGRSGDTALPSRLPSLGSLIAFGYAGHRVWIFEGHPSALTAGLAHTEILLLDSGMLPLLQNDWMSVAQRMMDPPRRVLIHSRERYALLPAVPASTPQGWSYSEPDGEASYVN
jgi:hypothetical protein